MGRQFEWDEHKASANQAKHGLSFVEAIATFRDPDLVEVDASRVVDGELRSKAIGWLESRLVTIVFTTRGAATRLISARRANPKEESIYGNRPLHS